MKPEALRTWTLNACPDEHGELGWLVYGPAPERDRERVKVYEAAPVDAERERILLDLIERLCNAFAYVGRNAQAWRDARALLVEHGRLREEGSNGD